MLILPKWFNRYLTPEEEEKLVIPSRRVFTFGMLGLASTLILPKLPSLEVFFPLSEAQLDAVLTSISVAYMNSSKNFIAEKTFPAYMENTHFYRTGWLKEDWQKK